VTAAQGTDWAIDRIVSVTDGDTVRLMRSRILGVSDGLETLQRDTDPKGVAIRLVNLDTPERGEAGYELARSDLFRWLYTQDAFHSGGNLRVITYPGGGFDRLLGDIYVNGDIGSTASQHMLRNKNWPPYVRGK
jgi:endonuclease YncB( thermonuclease family)